MPRVIGTLTLLQPGLPCLRAWRSQPEHSQSMPPHLPRAVTPSPPRAAPLWSSTLTSQGSPPFWGRHLPQGRAPPPQGQCPLSSPGPVLPNCPLPSPEHCPLHLLRQPAPHLQGSSAPHLLGQTPTPLQTVPPHLPRQGPLPTSLPNSVPHVQHLCDLGPQTMSLEQADKACGGSPRCPRG